MYRQPNGRLIRRRPLDSMAFVRPDIHVIAGPHFQEFVVTLELEPRCSLQHDHPLMLVLVIPEPIGGRMAVGDDPFDPHRLGIEESLQKLVGPIIRDVGEEVLHC